MSSAGVSPRSAALVVAAALVNPSRILQICAMPFAGAYVPPKRSAAAVEGIAMLKAGAPAQKSGRSGKPHATTFRLSDDEQKLSWDGAGLGKLNVLKGERYVRVSSFLELLVGHESAVFQRSGSAAAASNMHLSLSLVLSQALPARPSSMSDVRSEVVGSAPSERETLDITCDDEESFGLWVAALRALMAEVRDAQFREAELDADGKPIPLPESDSALPPPPMPGASSLDESDFGVGRSLGSMGAVKIAAALDQSNVAGRARAASSRPPGRSAAAASWAERSRGSLSRCTSSASHLHLICISYRCTRQIILFH